MFSVYLATYYLIYIIFTFAFLALCTHSQVTYVSVFQEQRTSQLPLELDQITDDSAPARPEADVKSEYHKIA